MSLTIGEKIKVIMKRKNMTMTELSEITGQTRQNLSNKMKRDNFTEGDAKEMAAALGCELVIEFRLPDGTTI